MNKKIFSLFLTISLIFTFLVFRVYFLASSKTLKTMAYNQSVLTFNISTGRGNIYDRNFKKLVNSEKAYRGILDEGFTDYKALSLYLQDMADLLAPINKFPHMVDVKYGNFSIPGVTTFSYFRRYSKNQIMPHIIGYTNKDNKGVLGIEKEFDKFLTQNAENSFISYIKTGDNRILEGSKKIFLNEDSMGVITTIDRDIQEVIEKIGRDKIDKGSILVTNSITNEIVGMASFPTFNPYRVEEYINDENGALLNRNILNYTVGSIFKLVISAVALENGLNPDRRYYCNGSIEIAGHSYACHDKNGHGYVDMKDAIIKSCNPYFVNLAQSLTAEALYNITKLLGIDEKIYLSDTIVADSGTFPSIAELKNIGEKNSFSFGQGKLTSSPVHLSKIINAVLNDGYAYEPTLVLGTVFSTASSLPKITPSKTKIFSIETANFLKNAMLNVIERGTGVYAKPSNGIKAGGKTATAQTGQYDGNNEYLNGWFSGFYPFDNPKYTIIVMLDKGGEGGINAAPIFKEVVDSIENLN